MYDLYMNVINIAINIRTYVFIYMYISIYIYIYSYIYVYKHAQINIHICLYFAVINYRMDRNYFLDDWLATVIHIRAINCIVYFLQ